MIVIVVVVVVVVVVVGRPSGASVTGRLPRGLVSFSLLLLLVWVLSLLPWLVITILLLVLLLSLLLSFLLVWLLLLLVVIWLLQYYIILFYTVFSRSCRGPRAVDRTFCIVCYIVCMWSVFARPCFTLHYMYV